MAKGKNLNPADAYRKAQRKKELQKNKADRSKAKELSTVKKDTSGYEEEIQQLVEQEQTKPLDKSQKARLADLRAEVERIKAAKEKFVEAHPEQRKLVYRSHNQPRADAAATAESEQARQRKLFGKDGLPLHPERSIYYEPVMNPYGVPPPGMPYIEKPIEGEINADVVEDPLMPADEDEPEEDPEDADIPLPPGMPPIKNQPSLPLGAPPHGAVPLLMHGIPTGAPGPFPVTPMYPMPVGMPMPYPMPPGSIPPPPPPLPHMVGGASTFAGSIPPPHPPPRPARPPPVQAPPSEYTITAPLPPSQLPPSTATISAPAALRDLKAEATAFVPSAVKRKQAGGAQK